MTDKFIYFTEDAEPTSTSLNAIARLRALITPAFDLHVRNGSASSEFGHGIEDCDIVAGSIPTEYQGIEFTDYGDVSASRPLLFDIWPKTANCDHEGTLQLYPVKVTGSNPLDLVSAIVPSNVAYTSSNTGKATVHATSGLVTGVAAGQTTITATYTYADGKTVTATSVITVVS